MSLHFYSHAVKVLELKNKKKKKKTIKNLSVLSRYFNLSNVDPRVRTEPGKKVLTTLRHLTGVTDKRSWKCKT